MQNQEFKLKPSRQYLVLMGVVFLLSAIIVMSLPFAFSSKLLGLVLILFYAGCVIWQFGLLRSGDSIIAIQLSSDGRWLIRTNKKTYEAELRGDSTATGIVSLLRFKVSSQFLPKSCVIFRDSLSLGEYRKLLVVLKAR